VVLSKGDVIVYKFKGELTDARVADVYGDELVKVRHIDVGILSRFLGYPNIIGRERIIAVKRK
jgi:hypothetical protein